MNNLSLRSTSFPTVFGPRSPFWSLSFLDDILDNVPKEKKKSFNPAIDVTDTEGQYKIKLACPGISKEDLNIEVKNDQNDFAILSIFYEKKEESPDSFSTSSFHRRWTLPKDVNTEEISASYKQGVFTVIIPKTTPTQPNVSKIEVS